MDSDYYAYADLYYRHDGREDRAGDGSSGSDSEDESWPRIRYRSPTWARPQTQDGRTVLSDYAMEAWYARIDDEGRDHVEAVPLDPVVSEWQHMIDRHELHHERGRGPPAAPAIPAGLSSSIRSSSIRSSSARPLDFSIHYLSEPLSLRSRLSQLSAMYRDMAGHFVDDAEEGPSSGGDGEGEDVHPYLLWSGSWLAEFAPVEAIDIRIRFRTRRDSKEDQDKARTSSFIDPSRPLISGPSACAQQQPRIASTGGSRKIVPPEARPTADDVVS